ncbi:MAG: aryl-sulfate sulfotransferase [Ignavibacteria bacterium]
MITGNYHTPSFSRAVEYKLEETSMTATKVWEYRNNPDIYAFAMGNVQRLPNGNTLIGWGSATTTLSEVNPQGQLLYHLSLPAGQMSYRAFRFEPIQVTNAGGKRNRSRLFFITELSESFQSVDYD